MDEIVVHNTGDAAPVEQGAVIGDLEYYTVLEEMGISPASVNYADKDNLQYLMSWAKRENSDPKVMAQAIEQVKFKVGNSPDWLNKAYRYVFLQDKVKTFGKELRQIEGKRDKIGTT